MDKVKALGGSGTPNPDSSGGSKGKKLVGPYLPDVFHKNVPSITQGTKITTNVTSTSTHSHAQTARAIFHRTFASTEASQKTVPQGITFSQLKILSDHVPLLGGMITELSKGKTDADTLTAEELKKLKESPEFREYLLTRNANGQTPLIEAIENKDKDWVNLLIALEVNLNQTDAKEYTPLYVAIKSGQTRLVKILLEAGANPNAPNNYIPLLHYAVKEGLEKSVELLLRFGANPNYFMYYDQEGELLPLKAAINTENETILQLLFQYGVNPHLLTKDDQEALAELIPLKTRKFDSNYKPINSVIKFKEPPEITYGELLKWSQDFDKTDSNEKKYINIIASISDEDADDYDPDYCLTKKDLKSIKSTFDEKYWSQFDGQGNTQLINAIDQNDREKVKFYIALGADINLTNQKGESPLCRAIENGDMKMIQLLLSHGANPNGQDSQKQTALSLAILAKNQPLTELLLCYGANPHSVHPVIVVHRAMKGDLDAIKALLSYGANLDELTSEESETPLLMAINAGNQNIAEVLLSAGVNPAPATAKTENDPLYRAYIEENEEISKLLVEYGADLEIAEKMTVVKILSAIHGIAGIRSIIGKDGKVHEIPGEGFYARVAAKVLLKYLRHLFSLDTNKIPSEITAKIAKSLENPVIKSTEKDTSEAKAVLDKAYTKYEANEPVLILGGTSGHAITIIVEKGKEGKPGKIIVCNRGLGAKETNEGRSYAGVYLIPSNATEKEVKELLKKFSYTYDDMYELNEMIRGEVQSQRLSEPIKNGEKTISVDKEIFEEIYEDLTQKSQKSGNCTWANIKSALLVMLVLELGVEKGKAAYKEISKATRDLSQEWLKNTYPDLVDLIQAIDRKKEIKLERRAPSPKSEWISRNPLENYKVDPINVQQLKEFQIFLPDEMKDVGDLISAVISTKVDPSDTITIEEVNKIRIALQKYPDNISFLESELKRQIRDGKSESITFLLALAANPDGSCSDILAKIDATGEDLLNLSLYVGTDKTTELLLHYGANPNVQYPEDQTPLSIAQSNGLKKQIELLLKYGAVDQAPPKSDI